MKKYLLPLFAFCFIHDFIFKISYISLSNLFFAPIPKCKAHKSSNIRFPVSVFFVLRLSLPFFPLSDSCITMHREARKLSPCLPRLRELSSFREQQRGGNSSTNNRHPVLPSPSAFDNRRRLSFVDTSDLPSDNGGWRWLGGRVDEVE